MKKYATFFFSALLFVLMLAFGEKWVFASALIPSVESSLEPEVERLAPLLPLNGGKKTLGGKERISFPVKPLPEARVRTEKTEKVSASSSPFFFGAFQTNQTASIAALPGANLIQNPSLETANTSGNPEGWNKGGYGTNTRTFSYPVSGHNGAKAAKVSISSYTSGDAKWYFTDVPVTAGKTYQFSNWYISNISSIVSIRYKKSDGTFSYVDLLSLPASAGYRNVSAQFTVPSGAVSLTAFHLIKGVGFLTVDDFSLTEAGNLIPNGNLETAGTGGNPEGWGRGGAGVNTRTYTYPISGADGGKAAKVSISSYTSGDAKWYFSPIALSPGIYTYSDRYLSNIPSVVTVQYHYTDGTYGFKDIKAFPSSSSFGYASVEFTVPVNVQDVTVFHLIESMGFLTIDNAVITKKSDSSGIFLTGGVSLTFDDGWLSQLQNAVPKLEAAGLRGTFFIVSRQLAEDGFPGYMSRAQVKDVFNLGHEIGAHTRTHVHLSALSETGQQNQIAGSRQDLIDRGLGGVTSFAYPFGDYNATTLQLVKNAGFLGARTSIGGTVLPTEDKYQLERRPVNVGTTLAQVKQWIDDAAANKHWLILVFHEVNTSGNQYSTTPATFNGIVDYLVAKKIPVVTVKQGIQDMEP